MTQAPINLLLASTSLHRAKLLKQLGLTFTQEAPGVDEELYRGLPPVEMARSLAEKKARALQKRGGFIIGSDQVLEVEGEVLGKPGSAKAAVEQLMRLSGKTHRLITAVALLEAATGRIEVDVDVHRLTMHAWSRLELEAYVAHDQPLQCAGSYMLERRGIALFERIEADPDAADSTAVVGLPLMKLVGLFRRFGVEILRQ
jgi:septum formation protein